MVETFVPSTHDVFEFLKHQNNQIKDMFEVSQASETAEEMVVHPRARQEVAEGCE